MKTTIATLAAAVIGVAGLSAQQIDHISASSTIAFESEYVFRGGKQYTGSGEAIQPGLEASHPAFEGDLYLGYWGSYSVNNGQRDTVFQETDLYLGYGQEVTDIFSVDGGFTYYGFSDTNGQDSWKEIYFGIAADYMLSPSVYAFYNFSGEAWTFEAAIGHSFDLSDHHDHLSLDLGAYAGVVDFGDANGDQVALSPEDGYTYAGASADLVYTINEVASVSLGVRVAGNNNDRGVNLYEFGAPDTMFWWGASASFGF